MGVIIGWDGNCRGINRLHRCRLGHRACGRFAAPRESLNKPGAFGEIGATGGRFHRMRCKVGNIIVTP